VEEETNLYHENKIKTESDQFKKHPLLVF